MRSFEELAASRREWISEILQPWCEQASRLDLLKAAAEWLDFAGNIDADKTLWAWAWARFPALVHEELGGIDESTAVQVLLNSGAKIIGYPDARESTDGALVLLAKTSDEKDQFEHKGPFSIDEITEVSRIRLSDPE